MIQYYSKFIFLLLCLFILSFSLLLIGPVDIQFRDIVELFSTPFYADTIEYSIIWELRIPKIITAILAGGSLAVSGLLMQSYFQNPLAGPFVLGVHSGASLSVAIWLLGVNYFSIFQNELLRNLGSTSMAIIGSTLTLLILVTIGAKFRNKLFLIVFGLILGHLVSGIIQILIVWSNLEGMKTFFLWSLGSFQRVSGMKLLIMSIVSGVAIIASFFLSKPLNLILLGDNYAKSSGLSLRKFQFLIILLTGVLAGTVTSFCGPIVFVGIIAPHLTKKIIQRDDHRILLPVTFLMGALISVSAELLSTLFVDSMLPLNAVLGLIGTPIIFFFLISSYRESKL